jgi:hypothetical protein
LQVAAQNKGRGGVATPDIAGFKRLVEYLLGSVATTFPSLKRRLDETGNNHRQAAQVRNRNIENLGLADTLPKRRMSSCSTTTRSR